MLGNGQWEGKTFINLKLVAVAGPIDSKADAPKFVKMDENFKPTNETFTNVSGLLTKIKPTFTAAKGKMGDIYGFKAFLEEGEEVYVIESTITNASKDILNSLIPNIGKKLAISVYTNKNQYPTGSVRDEDGQFVDQVLPFKDLDNVKLHGMIPAEEAPTNGDIQPEDIPF